MRDLYFIFLKQLSIICSMSYTEGQMLWRNALGASISTPAARRTWGILVIAAIIVDKIRLKNGIYIKI
jgi:hypothetical protein